MKMQHAKWLSLWCALAFLASPLKANPNAECHNMTGQGGLLRSGNENFINLWFRPNADWNDISIHLGNDEGTFSPLYELKISKHNKYYIKAKLITNLESSRKTILFEVPRIYQNYLTDDLWTSLSIAQDALSLTFRKSSQAGFEARFWGLQMKPFDTVELGVNVLGRIECAPPVELTTATTTTTTTTEPPPTQSITELTSTDSPSATSDADYDTTPEVETRSSEDPIALGAEDGAGCSCLSGAPLWAWVCAGVSVALLLLLLILAVYTVTLSRQNRHLKSRQSNTLRSRLASTPSTGLGVQANEVEFYQIRNPNVMIAAGALSDNGDHTTPRVFAGRQQAAYSPASKQTSGRDSSSTPRLSAFRRSLSQPANPDTTLRDPPDFDLPPPPETPPPPKQSFLDSEDEAYVNAETLMLDDSRQRVELRADSGHKPVPRTIDSLLKELQYE